MFVFLVNTPLQNTIAEQNVPNQPPTRTNEQIIPRSQWLTIEKSNLLFNAQKIQKNPSFGYQWNILTITPVIPAQPFELPPSGNTVIDFVNELGYPEPVEIVSNIRVNYVYQPWRAILTLINQCLTGKTSGQCQNRHPVRKCCGYRHQTNVDHAEDSLWEEFSQGIRYFSLKSKSHSPSLKHPRESTPLSSFFMDGFPSLSQSESVEVFGMQFPIPETEAIQTILVLSKYLEMGAENTEKPQESACVGVVLEKCTWQQGVLYPKSPQPLLQSNLPSISSHRKLEKESPLSNLLIKMMKLNKNLFLKKKGTVRGVTIRDPISKTTPKTARSSRPGKRPLRDQSPHDSKTGPSSHPEDDTSEKVIHESSSTSDSEHGTEVKQEAAALKVTRSSAEGPGLDQNSRDISITCVSLLGPKPEHMDDEFLADAYPKVS
ncbi:hypothetical protein Tco_0819062 [Tanacetum coccineum]|uniref:Uncharacterized protein n=1 Tax=Tanacetum coccineum TaxID=301880 RepID=A0ABQ5A6F8_9ASTR